MKWSWPRKTDSESHEPPDDKPAEVLKKIVHECRQGQELPSGVEAATLHAKVDERLRKETPNFLSWAQESRTRLDSAKLEAGRTELAGWAIAGALAVYLALALGLGGVGAVLNAGIIAGLGLALVGRLAWRLRELARDERKISNARQQWKRVLTEAIALPVIAQEISKLARPDNRITMCERPGLTGNGRDPEVTVISDAMTNVAATARTIGSGSIGISGPRGAGKSTILKRFDTRDAVWKPEQDIRVTVAAPVDYDAREFVIHLFTELCERVADAKELPERIARQTQQHREDLRFQRTYSSSWGPTLAPASFLSIAWSRGKQRAEQPTGLPALVAQFRAYSRQVAEWNWDRNRERSQESGKAQGQVAGQEGVGRVIICIDEMDKIRDSDRAEQFLNNIKAIFDVPGCLYLVAISEDAMTVFASQTPAIRTAFDSAFDEIISVPPMRFADAQKLLQLRTTRVPLPFLALCHVLAGGVPRELIRAARALMQEAEPEPKPEEEGGSSKKEAAPPHPRPAPWEPIDLGEVRNRLVAARCKVMRREAILQLSRSGAGGDILAPLHRENWPCGRAGGLNSDALKAEAKRLSGLAENQRGAQWATMCQDVAVALSFYATVTRLFDGEALLVVGALDTGHDQPNLIDELAIARHAMRTNSQLAAELLDQFWLPEISGGGSGAQ